MADILNFDFRPHEQLIVDLPESKDAQLQNLQPWPLFGLHFFQLVLHDGLLSAHRSVLLRVRSIGAIHRVFGIIGEAVSLASGISGGKKGEKQYRQRSNGDYTLPIGLCGLLLGWCGMVIALYHSAWRGNLLRVCVGLFVIGVGFSVSWFSRSIARHLASPSGFAKMPDRRGHWTAICRPKASVQNMCLADQR
jgi:hypothetical protein